MHWALSSAKHRPTCRWKLKFRICNLTELCTFGQANPGLEMNTPKPKNFADHKVSGRSQQIRSASVTTGFTTGFTSMQSNNSILADLTTAPLPDGQISYSMWTHNLWTYKLWTGMWTYEPVPTMWTYQRNEATHCGTQLPKEQAAQRTTDKTCPSRTSPGAKFNSSRSCCRCLRGELSSELQSF